MTIFISRVRSATFRKPCSWLSIAIIFAVALSFAGCRSSSETLTTSEHSVKTTRTLDSLLMRKMRLTMRERALVTLPTPLQRGMTVPDVGSWDVEASAEPPRAEKTSGRVTAATPLPRTEAVVVEYEATVELTDTAEVKVEATAKDTLTARENRQEHKGRPPAATIALCLAALGGAIAAFGIDWAIHKVLG